jgi:hypothetical protein
MRRLQGFLALDTAQRGVLLWSLALIPIAAAVLRWRGFSAARAMLGSAPAPGAQGVCAESAARMVAAAGSFLGASCLPRSVVLWRLLRARGAVIRLGVALPESEGFAAHAWVEIDGCALNAADDRAARYAAFPSLPQA